jgi:Ras family
VATAKGQEWALKNDNMMFFETSAMDGLHVEEAFKEMARIAIRRNAEQ